MLKLESALADGWSFDNVACYVALQGLGVAHFEVSILQSMIFRARRSHFQIQGEDTRRSGPEKYVESGVSGEGAARFIRCIPRDYDNEPGRICEPPAGEILDHNVERFSHLSSSGLKGLNFINHIRDCPFITAVRTRVDCHRLSSGRFSETGCRFPLICPSSSPFIGWKRCKHMEVGALFGRGDRYPLLWKRFTGIRHIQR